MKIDLIFLIILGIVVGYIFVLYKVESMADVGNTDQIKAVVKEIYLADVDAIRNLSEVATKLQAGGLTMPGQLNIISDSKHIQLKTKNDDTKNIYLTNTDGHFRLNTHGVGDMFGVNKDGHHYIRHTGDHVMHVEGDGINPYISLGKTGTWDKKKLYIQNVDAHTENPTFRVGIHGDSKVLMNMNKSHGVYWPRKDGRNTHFDWEDSKNYIRGDTQHDNTLTVGKLCIGGTCIGEQELKYLTRGFYIQVADLPRSDNDATRWGANWPVHMHGDGVMRIASMYSAFNFKPVNGV